MTRRLTRLAFASLAAAAIAGPPPVTAQTVIPDDDPSARFALATWVEDAGFMAINGALAGVGAGFLQWVDGGSFKDGFTRGALGGVVSFGGKRLAAERFDGAGALGRSVAAVGSSMSRNASHGAPLFDVITVPVGPVWLDWDRGQGGVSWQLDGMTMYWIGYGIVEDRMEFDWNRSLSAGAPVFLVNGAELQSNREVVGGLFTGGLIAINGAPRSKIDDIASHERIHQIQSDGFNIMYGRRIEGGMLDFTGRLIGRVSGRDVSEGVERVGSRIYFGLGTGFNPANLFQFLDREHSWPEVEADYFQGRSR